MHKLRDRKTTTIGQIADVFDGPHATPPPADDGPVFLGISSLQNGRIDLTQSGFISEDDYPRWTKRVVPQQGDVVFSYETRLGEAAIIPDGLRCCLGRRLALMRPDREQVHPRYLLYYYLSTVFQEEIRKRTVHGATVDRILLKEFPDFRVLLPPLPEQNSIAEVLGALDDKIELNRKMNATLDELARTIFRSWFVDFDPVRAKMEGREPFGMDAATAALFPDRLVDSPLGPIPQGWEVKSLGDIADNIRDNVPANALDPADKYVGLEHIPKRNIGLAEWDNADAVSSNKSRFRLGDVLFGKLRPYFHKVVVAPVSGVCSTDVLVIRPKSAQFHALTICAASCDQIVALATSHSSGTRMPRAKWADLASFPIAMPNVSSVIGAFELSIAPMINMIGHNVHESRTLAELRDTLLPELISGRIRVSVAEKLVGEAV